MIKKLALTTIVVFLALGAVFPHSLNAQAGLDCGDGNPAGNSVFCVSSTQVNEALGKCPQTHLEGITKPLFTFASAAAGNGTTWDAESDDICKTTGKAINALTQLEITAYFQGKGNSTGGLNGILSNVNAMLLDQRPASGIDFVSEKVYAISNFGKVAAATDPQPSTYYPGPGSELLRPIQGFWGWSVNLVFGFLVLLIIIVALAIMFRQRLGGAAEVTIQNAIPSIALAMILIPLSYAISGLFIDAITLGTNAVHGFLLGPQSPGAAVYANRDNADTPNCDLQSTDVGSGTTCDRGLYADDPTIDVWRARDRIDIRGVGSTVGQGINNSLAGVPSAQSIFNLIGSILKLLPGDENQFSEFAWFGNVINIIIGILTIWIALKIFFKLIGKYLTLIIFPAFSPFIFATAALPGNGTKSIVTYLKTLGSCALFYIVTYAMFILTLIFTDPTFQNSLPDFRTSGYIPPLLGIQSILKDLTATANAFPLTQLLMTLVGLGIYFSIPKALDGIDEALGTKFVLPQIIKTPFESAAQSLNTTLKGAQFIARTAPNAIRTARTELNPSRLNTRLQAFRDSRRGLNPGEEGTYTRTQSTALAKQKAAAERTRAAAVQARNTATTPAARSAAEANIRAANDQLEQIDRTASRMGVNVGYDKDTAEPEIKATVDFNGNASYVITEAKFKEFQARFVAGAAASPLPEGFKIKFEAVGFTLPGTIQLVSTTPKAKTGVFGLDAGRILVPNVAVFAGEAALSGASDLFPPPPNINYSTGRPIPTKDDDFRNWEIRVKRTYVNNPDSTNKKFELPLELFIKDPFAFFNSPPGTAGSLSLTTPVETDKVIFTVGGNESNPVSVKIEVRGT